MIKVVRKTTRGDVTKTILLTIQTAGILSIALLAPNVLTTLNKLGVLPSSKKPNDTINRARDILLKNGDLKKDPRGYLRITEKGYQKLNSYLIDDYVLKIPRIWDKKWHIIIFDISEKKRIIREKLRKSLVTVGFVRLQNSVWVFPYDCSEFISLLKADFKIGREILYMTVDQVESDGHLKKHFKLK
jgi:DNA-binding transcriptional regulator PaaX